MSNELWYQIIKLEPRFMKLYVNIAEDIYKKIYKGIHPCAIGSFFGRRSDGSFKQQFSNVITDFQRSEQRVILAKNKSLTSNNLYDLIYDKLFSQYPSCLSDVESC